MAYAIGIGVSALVVLRGCHCLQSSKSSFTSSFSAILRTTRNSQLDAMVSAKDTKDTATISKDLGETELILVQKVHGGETRAFFEVRSTDDEAHELKKSVMKKETLIKMRPRQTKREVLNTTTTSSARGEDMSGGIAVPVSPIRRKPVGTRDHAVNQISS